MPHFNICCNQPAKCHYCNSKGFIITALLLEWTPCAPCSLLINSQTILCNCGTFSTFQHYSCKISKLKARPLGYTLCWTHMQQQLYKWSRDGKMDNWHSFWLDLYLSKMKGIEVLPQIKMHFKMLPNIYCRGSAECWLKLSTKIKLIFNFEFYMELPFSLYIST